MKIWGDTRPDCDICASIQNSLQRRIEQNEEVDKIPKMNKANIRVEMSSIGNQMFRSNNPRTLHICNKHQRMWVNILDKMVDDTVTD